MSAASLAQRQISRAKSEAAASLASARSLRDQWVVAVGQNPTGLTQKEIDHLSKAFKNRLLTVKWDCEDLEELVSGGGGNNNNNDKNVGPSATGNAAAVADELAETRGLIQECRNEIASCMEQLDDYESGRRLFSKHGLAPQATATTTTSSTFSTTTLPNKIVAQAVGPVASIIQNPLHGSHYERLSNELPNSNEELGFANHNDLDGLDESGLGADSELPHFDKRQIETSTTIFNNALYEHFEDEDALTKSINATKVFNNLTRPSAEDICVGTNENEMILEMLETEYYNPPAGLLAKTKYNNALRNFFDADRNKFLGTIVFLFSFPILLILFLVI